MLRFPKLPLFSRWPNRRQWVRFFAALTKTERILFVVFLVLFAGSTFFLIQFGYLNNTTPVASSGGMLVEGVIGQPRFLNPLYANADVDRDLVQLVFSGLMKYDAQFNLVSDLAETYELSDDRKTYTFHLKEHILWHDGEPLTVDDVVFTIKAMQNPEYKSPFQADWVGVEVEKRGDLTVAFTLRKPYSAFLENATVKILPRHIWEATSPEDAPLQVYKNLHPIGSGPYRVTELDQDRFNHISSITLAPNPRFFGKKPYISKIKFEFFDDNEALLKEVRRGKIDAFSLTEPVSITLGAHWQSYQLAFPRYFAVFFNPKQQALFEEAAVRHALVAATDTTTLVKELINGSGTDLLHHRPVTSPTLPAFYGAPEPTEPITFDLAGANELLDEAGFTDDDGDGIREKTLQKNPSFQFTARMVQGTNGTQVGELQKCLASLEGIYPSAEVTNHFGPKTKAAVIAFQEHYAQDILEPWGFTEGTGIVSKTTRAKLNELCFPSSQETLTLRFGLSVIDQPLLVKAAHVLKEQWGHAGVDLQVQVVPSAKLEQDVIKPRVYDSLLFGEVLGAIPDPLPFWHSSQKNDPGLNLALYESVEADEALEAVRSAIDTDTRFEQLALFQDILLADAPAVFLWSPDYVYWVTSSVLGVDVAKIADPSQRFTGIEEWYMKTRRVWK